MRFVVIQFSSYLTEFRKYLLQTRYGVALRNLVYVKPDKKLYFLDNIQTEFCLSEPPWANVTGKPAAFPPSVHNHDDDYYTEAEVDVFLAGKSDVGHLHDDRYYTESEVDALVDVINEVVPASATQMEVDAGSVDDKYVSPLTLTESALDTVRVTRLHNPEVPGVNWSVDEAKSLQGGPLTGTPPFVIASTTLVSNLNADLLDGSHGSAFATTALDSGKVSKLYKSDAAAAALSADASGYLSAVVQPLFAAYVGTTITNVTGDGTNYTIVFNTEIVDRNSNYNTGTGAFTAPVTGKYLLSVCVYFDQLAAGHTLAFISINSSNRGYVAYYGNPSAVASSGGFAVAVSAIADMDAGDTAGVLAAVYLGSKVVDIKGDTVNAYSYFAGYLLP